ncbi:MAG: DUF4384 domain-containing protein [Acidobacteria bacterium]|nr:DUF4384 domain-containing protein [Acidobacteriota bacterium]
MRTNLTPFHFGAILTGLAVAGLAAQEAQINARDAFFSAADLLAVNKGQPAKGQKTAKAATPAAKPPSGAAKPDAGRASGPKPELALSAPPKDTEEHFRLVSQKSAQPLPMGLRYSLLKKGSEGVVEVRTDAEFRAGDSIRLSVMGNQKGYLYVIARGTSGVWSPLFPHPESSQQGNEIVPGRAYQVPGGPGEYFTFDEQPGEENFDEQPGEEKVFIMLSNRPVSDIEELIQSLTGKGPSLPDRPVQAVKPSTMQAASGYDDGWVEKLRAQVQSRDLVFTRVEKEAAQAGEQAVYVVNTAGAASGGRVVVDLSLKHR